MVVMWCRSCGALVGLRQPFTEWTADRTGVCPLCAHDPQLKPADGIIVDDLPAEDGKSPADEPDDRAQ